ncbi:hypothetical protein JW977_00390 [Candidatus Falkowbacteria bacterium]|nr:hypothetical protein [Candidatus Falkowbacteria bacterium]
MENEENDTQKRIAILILCLTLMIQIITLAFLWKREWFNETWDQLREKIKGSKDPKNP